MALGLFKVVTIHKSPLNENTAHNTVPHYSKEELFVTFQLASSVRIDYSSSLPLCQLSLMKCSVRVRHPQACYYNQFLKTHLKNI